MGCLFGRTIGTLSVLVLGLGNTILTDDGVGILVTRAAAARGAQERAIFAEASVGGLRLLDVLGDHERIIMVDAIITPHGVPGQIHRLHPNELQSSLHSGSSHDLTLSDVLTLGRRMGMALPKDEDIVILAIEVEEVFTFGETCTPAVAAAIPRAVEAVLAELKAPVP